MQPVEKELLVNDRYIPLITDQTRHLVLYGGGGSGKSVFAAQKVVNRTLCEKPHKFLVLRKVADTIKESVFAEIQSAIAETGCANEFEVNKTEKNFLHRPTGNRILCKGLDEPEKIKSIKGITGMWIEEATEFTPDDLTQLNLRIRGEKENYVQYIYSFNPISEDNEVVKKFVTPTRLPEDTKVIHTTYHDNYFLTDEDKKQFEDLKATNPLFYDVYCLGIPGVVDKSGKFLYTFDGHKQIVRGVPMDPRLPIWATFDFNIDPMTCTIAQKFDATTLVCFKSIQLHNSDVHAMCDRIKTDYNEWNLICTGDASGQNETGVARGKSSYWKEIKNELNLKDHQLQIRSKNLGLHESRVLCNVVNRTMNIFLDEDGCAPLIQECKYAKVDERGILIKDRNKQKNDFLDGLRYLMDANWPDILNRPNKYKR